MTYKLVIPDSSAIRISEWFLDIPPGIRVWHSINLSHPEQQWITSIETTDKPHWGACSLAEAEIIRDPAEVAVIVLDEVNRFEVGVRISGNGLSTKLTDDSNDEVNRAVKAAGQYASYQFDYENQEVVILGTTREPIPLDTFAGLG